MLDQAPGLPVALLDFPVAAGSGEAATRQRWRFDAPTRWLVAHDPSQVAALVDAAHAHAQAGAWCVGWIAYEAAPGLDPHLPVKALPPGHPYAVWAVFDAATPWDGEPITSGSTENAHETPWQLGPWTPDLSHAEAEARIHGVHELIRAGEVYQVNLTTRLNSPYAGSPASPWACFAALRRSQPSGYTLMLDTRAACRTPGMVMSVSPELFFDWDGTRITTQPMKGTAARGLTPEADQAAAEHLRHSDKERAENLMIVDLLRNDLSRVAQLGSVQVPSLFDVQALPTVWQMTSTVTARTRPDTRLSDVLRALFPCGSVTGAPKRQAMHHIARLERSPRGVYCGASGVIWPGGRVTLNVPIRTLCLDTLPPPAPWRARCGIGSGITLDAAADAELREWQAKQAFLRRAAQPFALLESLRLDHGQIARRRGHLSRLAASARHFAYPWSADDEATVNAALDALCARHPKGVHKVRLCWSAQGQLDLQTSPLAGPGSGGWEGPDTPRPNLATDTPPVVQRATQAMPEADDFIRHKTTLRSAYAPFAPPAGVFDTLLYNAAGELTEFTIGNLALRLQGRWYTPPLKAGLLPGVMRASLLARGTLHERTLTLDDLAHAEDLALINSVRGWLPVTLCAATSP